MYRYSIGTPPPNGTIVVKTTDLRTAFSIALERLDNDEELLKTIGRIFIEDHGPMLDLLKTSCVLDRREQAEKAAHTLKGAVGNFGIDSLTMIARDIEIHCREANLEAARQLLPALQSGIEDLVSSLQKYCEE
ncbi:MAG: Hpt domain-containing protein [Burkholderiaceae bacterium]|nr:MAG: Hpt domain-containing protein [Burkholderiaceae bacterium]